MFAPSPPNSKSGAASTIGVRRGEANADYMREQDLANPLGGVLKGIPVPKGVASQIVGSLRTGLKPL